ncbi:ATP-binding cassette domain-containing protein [Paenibacillus antri]|uniref:ATP-binding cassette domain-containing protein n=1 Tax=Paenibacillus antri TaxID=2582848 RepID=A0A5R9GLN2_9BACL|nr:ATP-binding cassette domain-containing protein [Paenibacillus antri]TLS52745.1 ATP-binding cassette domain-containing protein [Paenibacillus antri]
MTLRVNNLAVAGTDLPDRMIVRDVSFAAEDRAITLVVGRSGSGKSTLLRAMAGLTPPSVGNVTFDERPLWNGNRPDRKILQETALAFQFPEHQLFAPTVQGEFDYSLRPYRLPAEESAKRISSALESHNLPPAITSISPFQLSGGQKRRVALATIMATRTPWLFLDEPSAGLDGHALARFTAELSEWKSRCGIVLATHDLDAFLPIADRVVVLRDGELVADVASDTLAAQPELLLSSGVGLPEAMFAASMLCRAGVPVPPSALTPERMAEAIAANARGASKRSLGGDANLVPAMSSAEHDSESSRDEGDRRGFLYRTDALRKWLAYTLVSVGIVLQTGWTGVAAVLPLAFGCMSALTAVDRKRLFRLCKPLFWLMAFAVAFSGIRFGTPFGFSFEPAIETFRRLFAFFEITAFGLVFTLSTSTADMKTGLERGLRPLKRIGFPVEVLALSASLVLRFIPLILEEADRFAAIAMTRGKRGAKPGQVHLLDLPVFVIPLLIALIQAVEDLIVALEMKGFMQPNRFKSVPRYVLGLEGNARREKQIVWAGLSMFTLLLVIRVIEEVSL